LFDGAVNIAWRKRASNELFGTDISKIKPIDYEKYGYLMDRNIMKSYTDNTGASQYEKKYKYDLKKWSSCNFHSERFA
jgi:hypothetical protein